MTRTMQRLVIASGFYAMLLPSPATWGTPWAVDFEELPVEPGGFYNGSDMAGGFESRRVHFNNAFADFGDDCCWNGWGYSQTTDVLTPGPGNQYSAYQLPDGGGAAGSETYAIAFSGADAGGGIVPEIELPPGATPVSVATTNTTYAALSMRHGDGFAKKFGGLSGNDPDWLRLTVEGLSAEGQVVGAVSMYLADYRFSEVDDDFIRAAWTPLDLTSLAESEPRRLAFRLQSSDVGPFGMNTPAYVAIDNLILDVSTAPPDFNGDGAVDSEDLLWWDAAFGSSPGAPGRLGDATGDGLVVGADFLSWQRLVNGGSTLLTIPEPTAGALAALGLWALAGPRQRAFRVRSRQKLAAPRAVVDLFSTERNRASRRSKATPNFMPRCPYHES